MIAVCCKLSKAVKCQWRSQGWDWQGPGPLITYITFKTVMIQSSFYCHVNDIPSILLIHYLITYVTGFVKTVLNGTFSISRNTVLK